MYAHFALNSSIILRAQLVFRRKTHRVICVTRFINNVIRVYVTRFIASVALSLAIANTHRNEAADCLPVMSEFLLKALIRSRDATHSIKQF